jgi:hypothetical protein
MPMQRLHHRDPRHHRVAAAHVLSSIPRQLSPAPMMLVAIGIELAHHAAV